MSSNRSTTAQGNQFRDSVKRLVELTPGCTNVHSEYPVGSQPVDLYYEEHTSFRKMRVACECKDHGRPLTKELIASNIYPRYAPLLQKGLIDAVRIIAPLGLGATARQYVQECGFSFHTLDQLEAEIIDFRQYLTSLKRGYAEDGLDRYYISALLEDGRDLESTIESWIDGDSSQPVAILAGYGMGKTSFARRLAARLAERALADPRRRIPILIPLSEISSEQALEGLLGKLLAAQHRIPGYHFSPFNELNRRGRFVVILDGFDEMKHTISWSEFKHNFSELNRLNAACARVVLLGRPSALLSEDEESYVLKGQRRVAGQLFTVTGAPEYHELRIAAFTEDQAIDFIRKYASYRAESNAAIRGKQSAPLDIEERIESLQSDPQMMTLILRPVQARMFADLAIDPEVRWRSFSRYELYQEFIERITEREARKPARSAFGQDVRLRFIRRVAWWLWRRSSSAGFNIEEIPAALLGASAGVMPANVDEVRRDLVAGSILERKPGDNYYLSHRSFLEFLVAQYICHEGLQELAKVSGALTREVVSFIKESKQADKIARWSRPINDVEGVVSPVLLSLIAWGLNESSTLDVARVAPDASPRDVMIGYYYRLHQGPSLKEPANYLAGAFAKCKDPQTRITCLLGLLFIEDLAEEELKHWVRLRILAFIVGECLSSMKRFLARGFNTQMTLSPFMQLLLTACTAVQSRTKHKFAMIVHLSPLFEAIQRTLAPKYHLHDDYSDASGRFGPILLADLGVIDQRFDLDAEGSVVSAFFRKYPDASNLVLERNWDRSGMRTFGRSI
jgi:hypothetical protein